MKLKNYFYGFVIVLVIVLVINYLLSVNVYIWLF